MTWTLRDYQAHAVAKGAQFLRSGSGKAGGLIVQPTGSGKSLVIAGIVQALDAPCLVFQPTKEILEQNASKLLGYGYTPAVYSASMGTRDIGTLTLATIQSVKTRPDLFQQFPYVLIDECHAVNPQGGMYKEFLDTLGDVRVVGLTATPFRLHTDGYGGSMLKFLTRTRPRVFEHVLAYAQIPELVAKGYLVKPEYQIVPGFNRSEVELNSTKADYNDSSLKRYYNRSGFHDRLRRVVLRLLEVGRKNVLVFTRFVEDADRLKEAVPGAAVLSADTKPSMRQAIVEAFRAGDIPVVANVNVLGIGFDYPELETVVLARPTVSLGLYYQQVGRLMRPHPLKSSAWVVDMVDQISQFGPIEDLWLQPTGARGQQWEVVTTIKGVQIILTNKYFGDGALNRSQWSRGRPRRRRAV